MYVIFQEANPVGHNVDCVAWNWMGITKTKNSEVVFSFNNTYIISGYYEYEDLSDDGNEWLVIDSGFYDAHPFFKYDCIRHDAPQRYIDIARQFEEENSMQ